MKKLTAREWVSTSKSLGVRGREVAVPMWSDELIMLNILVYYYLPKTV